MVKAQAELAERNVTDFIRQFWYVTEAQDYSHNWHVDLMAEYAIDVLEGRLTRLIFNIPPRYMKSNFWSVFFPAWAWIKRPELRFIFTSYSANLSRFHSVNRRDLIQCAQYRRNWGRRVRLRIDQHAKGEFRNTRRGHMISTSVGGSTSGKGADGIIVDDPVNPQKAKSKAHRDEANEHVRVTLSTRLNNKETGFIVLIQQRTHNDDTTAHVKKLDLGARSWHEVSIPGVAEKKTIIIFPRSKRRVTRKEGDVLWPERENKQLVEEQRTVLGSYMFAAQYQQRPAPAGGGMVKMSWFPRFHNHHAAPQGIVVSCDTGNKDKDVNAPSVFSTFLLTHHTCQLVDVYRDRMEYYDLRRKIKVHCAKIVKDYNAPLVALLIEDKASGTQLIQELRLDASYPVIAFEPGRFGSKEVRLDLSTPTLEAGVVALPMKAPWLDVWEDELTNAPNVEFMDQSDTLSQFVLWRNAGIQTGRPQVSTL